MSAPRTFAALVDHDRVTVLEYRQEKTGFRLLDSKTEVGRFTSPEAGADALVGLLKAMNAKRPRLSIVLQHFGSFFHTLVLPPATEEHTRLVIQREVQRSFNIADPAIAFSEGASVERRDPSRAGGQIPRQVLIAGAPRTVIDAFAGRLRRASVVVEGITIIPDVFRRLFDALDGSMEATVMLVCLQNGPHVAFFVNGHLELAIDPPLSLDGEAPLDISVIIDQLERGAIFLRQQTRGTVATRVLLSAPRGEHESLASSIEARTGMRVEHLGQGIGSPETILAMGAVLAARGESRLDLMPRAPSFDARLKGALSGPSLLPTTLLAFAGVAVFWCAMQLALMRRTKSEVVALQAQAENAAAGIGGLRESVRDRERIAGIRATLAASEAERRVLGEMLLNLSAAVRPGTQFDSITVYRVEEGLKTVVFARASAGSGPAAIRAATSLYEHFQRLPGLKNLDFDSKYLPRAAEQAPGEEIAFTISFVAPDVEAGS